MKKVFLALASLLLGAISLSAQNGNVTPPPGNSGQSGHGPYYGRHDNTDRQAWANLTPEQRGQVHQLLKTQHEEIKACRANGTPGSCSGLFQKQRTERQNLAQSLGLKHLPMGWGRRGNGQHKPGADNQFRSQFKGQNKPVTPPPSH